MKRTLVIGIEIALLFCILSGLLLFGPSIVKSQDGVITLSLGKTAEFYQQALTSPFKQAAAEVKDEKLAAFLNKFVSAMNLEKQTTTSANSESGMANLLPDIKAINKAALTMPLKEAGKDIKDKEIAQFYNEFLKNSGNN